MKMWAGRFKKETDEKVNDFNSSISFDCRLFEEDIKGSIAHATMLYNCKIIENVDYQKIIKGLSEILDDIHSGKIEFTNEYEDIHMCIEAILTERIGVSGKKLHTARSRNDQVALDIRLYIKKEILNIKTLVKELIEVILAKAEENFYTIMPGYTHLQRAQPVTFAHYIMAYAQMLKRDLSRLSDTYDRMNEMPLGSGALATTTYPIDRQLVCELLEFEKVTENSLDSVSDRDFIIELGSCLSILMMHLSRFSEEIIFWCSSEAGFVTLDDAFSTGSSIMPQKKNPDVAELVRGKTGRVYGNLMSILTVMKALPLAYNKDMQEDKEGIFDSIDTVKMCISVFMNMFDTLKINKGVMEKAALGGFINATDCADYLVKKGLAFRDAYKIVGQLVGYCTDNNKDLMSLSLEEYKKLSSVFDKDVYDAISLETCVKERRVFGGPSKESVEKQIKNIRNYIAK